MVVQFLTILSLNNNSELKCNFVYENMQNIKKNEDKMIVYVIQKKMLQVIFVLLNTNWGWSK